MTGGRGPVVESRPKSPCYGGPAPGNGVGRSSGYKRMGAMTRKKTPPATIRPGKPSCCISCGQPLHRKSEYYCSANCADAFGTKSSEKAPPFLSKWKIRKRKQAKDPLIVLRQKVRRQTKDLIRRGVLRRGPCVVCGDRNVVPHHEGYSDPRGVIWLCEDHHNEYHEGKIALFGGTLRWDPNRLTDVGTTVAYPKEKYRTLRAIIDRNAVDGDSAR